MTAPVLPRSAARLLRWAVGSPDVAEGILGDLAEDFSATELRRGRTLTLVWCWIQVLMLVAVFLVRGRSVRGGAGGVPGMITGLLDEVRQVVRSLRRSPGFTALCVVVLALGIGASSAVFDGFRSVVLADLPVADPDRIVTLSLNDAQGRDVLLTPDQIAAVGAQAQLLSVVAGVRNPTSTMPVTESERPLLLDFAFVTWDVFSVLDARPALGRFFHAADGEEGAPPVTVISHRTWQRDFAGAEDVLGRRLVVTQYQGSYEIIGVAPAGLDYPVGVDYWILPGPRRQAMGLIARMVPGGSEAAAGSEFLALGQAIDEERESPSEPTAAVVRSLTEAVVGGARPILVAIAAAAGLLLLLTCANVSGLLLIRASRRARDVTVRRALGASRGRIARSVLIESGLLGLGAGVVGLAVSDSGLRLLVTLLPGEFPRAAMIGESGPPFGAVLLATAVVVTITATVASVATIRGGGGAASPARHTAARLGSGRARRTLVGSQVALAVVVLFGAGLLTRTFQQLSGLPLGYEANGVSVLELGIDRQGLAGPAELTDLLSGAFARMRAVQGVTSVTPLMARPFTGEGGVYSVTPVASGQTADEASRNPRVPLESGGTELFQTLGIPITSGRGFRETDRDDSPNVVVVSEALATQLWPGRDPVGERVRLRLARDTWWTVVGVAGETRFRALREETPTLYLPWRQFQILPMAWTAAVRMDRAAPAGALADVVRRYDPRVYLWRITSLQEHLGRGPLATPRTAAVLVGLFGVSALALAALGLYGVMMLAVQQQTRELGIRRALGASDRVLRLDVLGDTLQTSLLGCIVGITGALFLGQLLTPILFDVSPMDPATLLGVPALILSVTALATYAPVRRATRIDPRVALQEQ